MKEKKGFEDIADVSYDILYYVRARYSWVCILDVNLRRFDDG